MSIYRLADVNIAYCPQSATVATLLKVHETDGAVDLPLSITPSMIEAEAVLLPDASNVVWELASLLRSLQTGLLPRDRLVLHASCVVWGGKAYAFLAPSGVGKTTHARLWEQRLPDTARILNGDRLLVHVTADGARAYGNPWRGKEGFGYVGDAPLGGLFFLTRADRSSCEPLSAIEALPYLLRATSFPPDAASRLCVLSLLERLTATTPLFRLYATPSVDAVDAVLNAIGGTL